jgi:hypothetical protein
MLRRLIFDHWLVIFPLISFIVAGAIYFTITWRALHMRKPQIDHLASLPFNDEPGQPPRPTP